MQVRQAAQVNNALLKKSLDFSNATSSRSVRKLLNLSLTRLRIRVAKNNRLCDCSGQPQGWLRSNGARKSRNHEKRDLP